MKNNCDADGGTAIQIVTTDNHRLDLKRSEFERILGSEHLQDHFVVAVSVAGSLRTGKSFLLNFFVKYLRAQVSPNILLSK